MIPLARDSRSMRVWKRTVTEESGEFIEDWSPSGPSVRVSVYPMSASRTQTQDGQVVLQTSRLVFVLPAGFSVSESDRLGDATSAKWSLTDVKQSGSSVSCVGVML